MRRRFLITYYTYWEPEESIEVRSFTFKGAKKKALKYLKKIEAKIYTIKIENIKGRSIYI